MKISFSISAAFRAWFLKFEFGLDKSKLKPNDEQEA
jgi:hypothetical protein